MIFDNLNTVKIPNHFRNIYFGMGCFWGAEKVFWDCNGVYTTIVGYSGGNKQNPTYEDVCNGQTGHAEIVKVIYDKDVIVIDKLNNPDQYRVTLYGTKMIYSSITLTELLLRLYCSIAVVVS